MGIKPFWAQSARSNRREKNFSWTRSTSCLECWNQTFLGSGGRNESNSNQLALIDEKKIFHEVDVHHIYKVGIKLFGLRRPKWVEQPIAGPNRRDKSLSSTLRSSCLQSRNQTFLRSLGRNDSNSYQVGLIDEKKIFHELDVHHV